MYIKSVKINNVRSVRDFEMNFEEPAGWHVIIGDNGVGKTSVLKSIAAVLIGKTEIDGITPNWNEWLTIGEAHGEISLELLIDKEIDGYPPTIEFNLVDFRIEKLMNLLCLGFNFSKENEIVKLNPRIDSKINPYNSDIELNGWFSASFGSFRRFSGGSVEKNEIFNNPRLTRLASHLSLFGEDVALSEALKWLDDLNYRVLEGKVEKEQLDKIISFINSGDFLPNDCKLDTISSDGIFFLDGYGAKVKIGQLSDGYRSVLSLAIELMRQLARVYGLEKLTQSISTEKLAILLPGVVLIDEIDAHLHPTWQTRIGQWFTKHFPAIQFIVTTHSPLICRASEKGSIWRLFSEDDAVKVTELNGTEKNRLIFGNVLDAYGTNNFGKNVSQNEASGQMKMELVTLSKKQVIGRISEDEIVRLNELRTIFSTDDTINQ